MRCDGATTLTGSHWTKPRSRITETIISLAGPVGTLPARCCFVTANRLAVSKDVEIGVSLNGLATCVADIDPLTSTVCFDSGPRGAVHPPRTPGSHLDDDFPPGVSLLKLADGF